MLSKHDSEQMDSQNLGPGAPPEEKISPAGETAVSHTDAPLPISAGGVATGYTGTYRILGLLGSGGMSDVYKASIESIESLDPISTIKTASVGRIVACKVLLSRLLENKQHYRRFQHEAKLAKRLAHPNIVNVYDAGEIDGRPFMILEYVDGATLSDICKRTGKLPIERALPIFVQISAALAYAHLNGVIHRDLKPSNIMLTRKNDREDFVKVVDFGIAKIVTETMAGATQLTKTGDPIGTPAYMSPEQCRGEDVTAATDIYSFGIVMYEVLTGRPPFEASEYYQILYKHMHEMPDSIRDIDLDIRLNRKMENIILKCLAKQADARYQSMDDVKHDLETIITSGASGSKTIAKLGSTLAWIGRKTEASLSKPLTTRQWLLAGLAVFVIAIGVTIGVINQFRAEAVKDAVSFLKELPGAQRTITWVEQDAAPYARDNSLFHEMENKLVEKERMLRAIGETHSVTTFEFAIKFGDFYLSAGALGLAEEVFRTAQKLADSLKLADDPETCKDVADLELRRAKCAFGRSNYDDCIIFASKSLNLLQIYNKDKNYEFFASEAIPAWELVGRAAEEKKDSQLAKKAFLSVYEIGKKNDYFKVMPERNAYSFGRAADFFTNSNDLAAAETLLDYALSGWQHISDRTNEAITITKLGILKLKSKDWQAAVQDFQKSQEILMQNKNVSNELLAKILLNEAEAYQMGNQQDKVIECAKEAKRLWFAPHSSSSK